MKDNILNKRVTLFMLAFVYIFNTSAQKDYSNNKVIETFEKDIRYLASDELGGRLTGEPGELKSAEYIAAEFKRCKMKPMGDNESYFQKFYITKLRLAGDNCQLKTIVGDKSQSFKLFSDFYPLSPCPDTISVNGQYVDVNYGISAKNHDDYSKIKNLSNKIFLIKIGYPGDNAHSEIASKGSISAKINNAMKHEAKGVIFYLEKGSKFKKPSGELKRNDFQEKIPVIFFTKDIAELKKASTIDLKIKVLALKAQGHNVVGFKNNHKKHTIVIGAHHDHLGMNELGGSRQKKLNLIHNGADDNASGVAMMMALMRKLHFRKYHKFNYLFVAFSGEELGLIGSKYLASKMPVDIKNINYMINFDMVGRFDTTKRKIRIYGVGTSPSWKSSLNSIKNDTNQYKILETATGVGASDHTSFYLKGIPVLHLFTGRHLDYHMPTDDAFKINYEGMKHVYNYTLSIIKSLNKEDKLSYTKTKDSKGRRKFKVTLGIMPDYVFDGKGLKVDAVTEGNAGAKAGLIEGDIIIKIGDIDINGMRDYMKVLQKHSKKDKVKMIVKRNGVDKTLNLIF